MAVGAIAFALPAAHEAAARVGQLRDQRDLLARCRAGRRGARVRDPARQRPLGRAGAADRRVALGVPALRHRPAWRSCSFVGHLDVPAVDQARRRAADAVPQRAVPLHPHARRPAAVLVAGAQAGAHVAAHRRRAAQGPRGAGAEARVREAGRGLARRRGRGGVRSATSSRTCRRRSCCCSSAFFTRDGVGLHHGADARTGPARCSAGSCYAARVPAAASR